MPLRPSLPPEFDVERYKQNNADLADLSTAQLESHYRTWGKDEGRDASSGGFRETFLSEVVMRDSGPVLELGPFCDPALRGENVKYFDLYQSDELRNIADSQGLPTDGCPKNIDYTGSLGTIDALFNAVFSSHSIEHYPDLISHLRDVENLLDSGGRYYIIIPDKRYCFDAGFPSSSLEEVMTAYSEKRTRHTLKSVIAHMALTVHNEAPVHWSGDHGSINPTRAYKMLDRAISEYFSEDDDYVDVHSWYFTPESFLSIVAELFRTGITNLNPIRVYQTPVGRVEFCAVLEKRPVVDARQPMAQEIDSAEGNGVEGNGKMLVGDDVAIDGHLSGPFDGDANPSILNEQ